MKRRWIIFISAVLVAAAAGSFLWLSHNDGGTAKNIPPSLASRERAEGPTVLVEVAQIREGTITANIKVYGNIVPAPGATQNISVPYESLIRSIMVSTGQEVAKGDLLLKIEPSPKARLNFIQAANLYESANLRLKHVKQLFDLKLATNTQILQAKQALEQAKSNLESLKQRGAGGKQSIHSDVGGLIKKVYIQEGSIAPAGAPLVEIIAQNRLEARLGIEPENINKVQPRQPVLLSRVNVSAAGSVSGTVREISHAVNASTRLVDVFVSLPDKAGFLLGEFVSGRLTLSSVHGMIVPRGAVLPENGHYVLFTVEKGHAVKQIVGLGLETAEGIEVTGAHLHPGATVVVTGSYELRDGMAVRTKGVP